MAAMRIPVRKFVDVLLFTLVWALLAPSAFGCVITATETEGETGACQAPGNCIDGLSRVDSLVFSYSGSSKTTPESVSEWGVCCGLSYGPGDCATTYPHQCPPVFHQAGFNANNVWSQVTD
jgi:hypothetical protein